MKHVSALLRNLQLTAGAVCGLLVSHEMLFVAYGEHMVCIVTGLWGLAAAWCDIGAETVEELLLASRGTDGDACRCGKAAWRYSGTANAKVGLLHMERGS